MPGTLITYQGFVAQSARLRRSRGFEADVSTVDIPLASFPDGFDLALPKVGDLFDVGIGEVPDLAVIRAQPSGRPMPPPKKRLAHAGTLCLAEAQSETWVLIAHPLFVRRIETVRTAETGEAIVRVTLVDERDLWSANGFLRRWSFNRLRGDGTVAADSVGAGGAPFSLGEIAEQVVAALPMKPAADVPRGWDDLKGPREFAPFSPAVSALAELVREKRLVEPCLRWDGSVGLHRPGDGRVGYARSGLGPNATDFPGGANLWARGTGHGHAIEVAGRSDYVIVVGGLKVQSAMIDGWEPVLVLPRRVEREDHGHQGTTEAGTVVTFEGEGRVIPLTEKNVLRLTGGKWGLEGLRRFVMAPLAYQQAQGLRPSVERLFREQAWLLFRLPGVENEDGSPGPNAHLLPLQDRAETSAGRRLPPAVLAYRWTIQHRAMHEDPEADAVRITAETFARIREQAAALARARAERDPFGLRDETAWDQSKRSLSAREILGSANEHAVVANGGDTDAINRHLDRLRMAEDLRAFDRTLGDAYDANLTAQAKADDAANGTHEALELAIARKVQVTMARLFSIAEAHTLHADFRRLLEEDARGEELQQILGQEIAGELEALHRAQVNEATRTRTGVNPADLRARNVVFFVRNLERAHDTHARIYSDTLGIVQLSARGGWANGGANPGDEPSGAPAPDACTFLERPVAVIFGCNERPSLNRSTSAGGTRTTSWLTSPDAPSWYSQAFRRGAAGQPDFVPLEAVPQGEGQVVPRRDLVELVPLEGEGNRAKLDGAALEIAAERFAQADLVAGAQLTLGRPWPVQCDGVVASVEIASRPGGVGFTTTIKTGAGAAPDPNPMRQRTRPPKQQQLGDSIAREGLGS